MADISAIKLPNDSTYDIKDSVSRGLLGGHSVGVNVPSSAVFTDTLYNLDVQIDTVDQYQLNVVFSTNGSTPPALYTLTAQDKADIADLVVAEIGSADTTAY